jgi:hypothetical protein
LGNSSGTRTMNLIFLAWEVTVGGGGGEEEWAMSIETDNIDKIPFTINN